jgi:Flp pilus assembly protein TadG
MRRRDDDRGAAAVEFALVLVPLLVIIFGLIQYGLYFYSAQTGSNTANAAVRQLSVGNCQTASDFQSYVDNQLGAASTGSASIQKVWTKADGTPGTGPTDALGGTVELTVSFPTINMHFPLVPFLSDSKVTRDVQARVEDNTDQGCG